MNNRDIQATQYMVNNLRPVARDCTVGDSGMDTFAEPQVVLGDLSVGFQQSWSALVATPLVLLISHLRPGRGSAFAKAASIWLPLNIDMFFGVSSFCLFFLSPSLHG